MARLDLSLLGQLLILQSGTPVTTLRYDKVRALLSYLVVERERAHRRESLATMFWPDQDEAGARHSLSQAIWSLRKAVEPNDDSPPLLLLSRATVQISQSADCWLDVADFQQLIDECAHHAHRRAESCRVCAERLAQAVDLYRGSFLEEFMVDDSADFEAWATGMREHLRSQAHQAIAKLIAFHYQRGDYDRSASYARRLLALDPWDEGAHRGLMLALVASGRRTAALAEYERFRQTLADELGVRPEAETLSLHRRILEGADEGSNERSVAAKAAHLSNLPQLPGPLIGRQAEMARIADLLGDPGCHLMTLTGPGGIGKTSLAIHAATEFEADFAGNVCFVSLAGLREAHLLPAIIAEALAISFYGKESPATQLLRYLHDRELLLVLDNFEHLIDDESIALVSEIVRRAPEVQLMVTSRERLSLQSEWVINVEGLRLPDGSDGVPEADGALELFIRCARRARWDFALLPEDRKAAIEICRLVDGVPLGIELAAAWVPVLSPGEIAGEIANSLDFLGGSARDLPDRHRSMRAVIDSTWVRLPSHQQRALARLSVFRGGFSRMAAEAVTSTSLATLSSLVDRSLLRHVEGRYEIHELLRQYAGERLELDAGAARVAHQRHSEHFLQVVAQSESGLRGKEQQAVLSMLRNEIENIRAAWRWATDNDQFELLSSATHGLWLFSDVAGVYLETGELLSAAITAIEQHCNGERDQVRDFAYGRLLSHRASFLLRTGDVDRGRDLLERGIAILSRLDVAAELGIALNFRAMLAHLQQDYEYERVTLQESIDEFAASSDRWGTAYSMNDLGMVSLILGDTPSAKELCARSLELFVAIGDRRGIGFALRNLGVIASQTASYHTARQFLTESMTIREAIGHRWGVADAFLQLGIAAEAAGEHDEARACYIHAREAALEVQAMDLIQEVSTQLGSLPLESASVLDLASASERHG